MEVTVVTTLFNYAQFIGDCIRSVMSQSCPAQMIIVDDCSKDSPYAVIKPLISQYGKRLKFIQHSVNRGYASAKNTGIEASTTDYLVMLDADDVLTENSISVRLNLIKTGYDFVHGRAINCRENSSKQELDTFFHKRWLSSYQPRWKAIHAQTVMLHRKVHKEIGLYDESLRCSADREMWARVVNHGYKIGYVAEPVCKYRIHANQMSRSDWKRKNLDELNKTLNAKIEKRANSIDFNEIRKLYE